MSESITVVARLTAKSGQEDRVRAQALSLIEPSLAEPGCLSYRPYEDPLTPGTWIVVEEWADLEAFRAHLASPHLTAAIEAGAELLAAPPTERVLAAIDTTG